MHGLAQLRSSPTLWGCDARCTSWAAHPRGSCRHAPMAHRLPQVALGARRSPVYSLGGLWCTHITAQQARPRVLPCKRMPGDVELWDSCWTADQDNGRKSEHLVLRSRVCCRVAWRLGPAALPVRMCSEAELHQRKTSCDTPADPDGEPGYHPHALQRTPRNLQAGLQTEPQSRRLPMDALDQDG